MKKNKKTTLILVGIFLLGTFLSFLLLKGDKEEKVKKNLSKEEEYERRVMNYNGVEVETMIYRPEGDEMDVLFVYHGTVMNDAKTLLAAERMLDKTRAILHRDDLMIISVAYPEENRLFGDNMSEAEVPLIWMKKRSEAVLGLKIKKIFLFGHSQGGYLVTRLNTLYKTDGVIANGAGPIDLTFRCKLEEKGKIKTENSYVKSQGKVCELLKDEYGSAFDSPSAYRDRSMINFASDQKARILFVQGMEDKNIQMTLWPKFKSALEKCSNCAEYQFLELEGAGHGAAFEDERAIKAINEFLK